MQNIINIIVFILVFGTIIIIHELGHFLAAKYFGVYCGQFSIGMGPKLWSKKIGETHYELRVLPIGGFVAMAGEADQEDNEEMKDVPLERTLKGIQTWKKIIIFLAGVFVNFITAYVVIIAVYAFAMPINTNSPTLGMVQENSPAMMAGIQENDTINKITVTSTGKEFLIGSFSDLATALNKTANQYEGEILNITINLTRDKQDMNVIVNATYNDQTDNYFLGVLPETRRLNLVESIQYGSQTFVGTSLMIFTTLGKLVTDSKETISQLAGPVGIYNATSQVAQTGNIANILLWFSMLGINVGVFNLLPIPGLDGSQVLFAIVEKIIGKEIPVKLKFTLQLAGLALVFGLMIIVTINDIIRIF